MFVELTNNKNIKLQFQQLPLNVKEIDSFYINNGILYHKNWDEAKICCFSIETKNYIKTIKVPYVIKKLFIISNDEKIYYKCGSSIWEFKDGKDSLLAGCEYFKGHVDSIGKKARFDKITCLCFDHSSTESINNSSILVGEFNGRIRKITTDGIVSTLYYLKGITIRKIRKTKDKLYVLDLLCTKIIEIYKNTWTCIYNADKFLNFIPCITCTKETLFSLRINSNNILYGDKFIPFVELMQDNYIGEKKLISDDRFLILYSKNKIFSIDLEQCWTKENHKYLGIIIKNIIKTIFLLYKKQNNIWSLLPRDMLFVICEKINLL